MTDASDVGDSRRDREVSLGETSTRMSPQAKYPPFPPLQSQAFARSFYFAFNKLSRPSIICLPGRAIQ